MPDHFSPMLSSSFTDAEATDILFVEAIVDDESEYKIRYNVLFDGTILTKLT